MTKGKKIAQAAFIIMAISIFSKVLGFVREMVIAAKYGASINTDAYLMSITIPTSVFAVVAGALATTFIPVLSEKVVSKSKGNAFSFTSNILNIVFFLSIAITVLGIIFAPALVKIIAPKFTGERYDLTVQLTRLMFPLITFIGLSNVLTGVLQSFNRFAAPAAVGLPFNIIIISTALFFTDIYGIEGLTIATVVAGLTQVLIQLPPLFKEGYKYEPIFDLSDDGVSKISTLIVPVIISTGVQQINTVVDRMMASGLAIGSISALNYGNRLIGFVSGIFIVAIATVAYPTMSKLSASNDILTLKKVVLKALNVITLIILPAVAGFVVLRYPIIRLLFERGAFDQNATQMTSIALLFLSFGLIGFGMRDFLNRAFYAVQDTKTPMVNGVFTVIANILLLLFLVRFMGIGGLALATSLSAILGTILMIHSLYKKIGDFGVKELLSTFIKTLLASTIMGIVVDTSYKLVASINSTSTTISQAVNLFLVIGIGGLVYLLIISFLNIEEVHMVFDYGKKFVNKVTAKWVAVNIQSK
ncbi:MAG TPA: murein biosynthesis integral membrane protein MurJ [Clostridia bacterium]|nr:murein biosynthesis integral membrane protein MurJ [Clostridia bacterium]